MDIERRSILSLIKGFEPIGLKVSPSTKKAQTDYPIAPLSTTVHEETG
jgi:hypothetical protein